MSVMINYQKRRPKGPSITCFADVEKIALRSGLTTNTMQMLKDRGYGSIKLMRDMCESDMELLPLYVGQQLALNKVVNHINEVLAGFIINDAQEEEGAVDASRCDAGDEEEGDGLTAEQRAEAERQAILERINKQGILSIEEYSEVCCAPRGLPRAHDFLVGKNSGKYLYMEEFIYASLLTLEFFMETSGSEVRPYMKHLRFIILKFLHGYPLNHIIYYDYAIKKKMETENILFPQEPDEKLLERYLRLMKKEQAVERDTKKKKKKKNVIVKKKK